MTGQSTRFTVPLIQEGFLEIVVRNSERRPQPKRLVQLFDEEGDPVDGQGEVETSVQGTARFEGIAPGIYVLLVEDTEREVEVEPGKISKLEITVR